MLVPAAFYLAIAGTSTTLTRGWAIPAAIDIAFALAVLALLGNRVPPSLKLLLTAVAVVDDLGAIAIIALAYTAHINIVALAAAGGILLLMFGMNRAGEKRLSLYLVLAAAMWVAVLLSGVHATIAGVLAALVIPITGSPRTPDSMQSPLHRLEHAIQPWVAFGIMPIFGFANAGVVLSGLSRNDVLAPLPIAIAAGLFGGKQVGVFASIRLAVALGLGRRPQGVTWLQVYGVAILCGVGFTMSFFIGELAFADSILTSGMKIGVLCGSILSALFGFVLLLLALSRIASEGDQAKSKE